jgi:hypothetical protein
MRNSSSGPKYLRKTVDAILLLTQESLHREISVKHIRRLYGIDAANRSIIRFYSNALAFLEREGVLGAINHTSPKKYALIDQKKLNSLVEG